MSKPPNIPDQVALLAAYGFYKGVLARCKEALAALQAESKRLGIRQDVLEAAIAEAEPPD